MRGVGRERRISAGRRGASEERPARNVRKAVARMTGMRGFFSGKQKPGDGGAPGGLEAPRPAEGRPASRRSFISRVMRRKKRSDRRDFHSQSVATPLQ